MSKLVADHTWVHIQALCFEAVMSEIRIWKFTGVKYYAEKRNFANRWHSSQSTLVHSCHSRQSTVGTDLLAFLLRILKVPSSNIGPDTGYRSASWFSSYPALSQLAVPTHGGVLLPSLRIHVGLLVYSIYVSDLRFSRLWSCLLSFSFLSICMQVPALQRNTQPPSHFSPEEESITLLRSVCIYLRNHIALQMGKQVAM
jgi:hypothetical protein